MIIKIVFDNDNPTDSDDSSDSDWSDIDDSSDNDDNPYIAGQTVSGQLILELTREKKTTGVFLKCIGEGNVQWEKVNWDGSSKIYTTNERYFKDSTIFLGQIGGPELILPAGTHVYPFAFLLPTNVPSSFEGKYGYVQYYLKATVKRNWKLDKTLERLFIVNGILDLNTYPGANTPIEVLEEKKLKFFLAKLGSVDFTFRVERSGFAPGEAIPIDAEIENYSNQNFPGVSVKLIMNTIYLCKHKTKESSETIFKQCGPHIYPQDQVVWTDHDNFKIPAVPPTDLAGCGIINVNYQLKVKLKLPGGNKISERFPIIIGTEPIHRNLQELIPSMTMLCVAQSEEIEATAPPPSSPILSSNPSFEVSALGYPVLPPPSYEETVRGNGDKGDGQTPR